MNKRQIKHERPCAYKRNVEERSRNHRCRGKVISIKYSEYVFVALVVRHAKRTRHIVICDLSGYTTFFHIIHKQHSFGGKKVIEQKMCVSIFFTMFV